MRHRIEQPAFGGSGNMFEIELLILNPVASEVALEIMRNLGVHGAVNVVEFVAFVKLCEPAFHAGNVVAFHAEADIDPAFHRLACAIDHLYVMVELVGRDSEIGSTATGDRVVAGDNESHQSALFSY